MSANAKPRTTTAVRFTPENHARLAAEAEARDMSMNLLVNRAVAFYLDRLLPVDEIQWTREPPSALPLPPNGGVSRRPGGTVGRAGSASDTT